MQRLSIIIPTLNEAAQIQNSLAALGAARSAGHEVIVVDGGSEDSTPALAAPLADQVLTSKAGRACQMNLGAREATGEVLLFLHADTRLPPDAAGLVLGSLARDHRSWGRFNIRLSGSQPLLRLVETLINIRSWLSGIATGDQAIFVRRELFETLGGYEEIPLMEDVGLSRALGKHSRPICLRQRATTSSRRWEERGIWRTIILMWRLRWDYWRGADPRDLARRYR